MKGGAGSRVKHVPCPSPEVPGEVADVCGARCGAWSHSSSAWSRIDSAFCWVGAWKGVNLCFLRPAFLPPPGVVAFATSATTAEQLSVSCSHGPPAGRRPRLDPHGARGWCQRACRRLHVCPSRQQPGERADRHASQSSADDRRRASHLGDRHGTRCYHLALVTRAFPSKLGAFSSRRDVNPWLTHLTSVLGGTSSRPGLA